ncbi:TonB-dependent receptor domain-containing protein [Pontibacter sp. 13R65]|uniref:TonB-dependent receptor n=1 Tax=Pontibacter sp. 13R65 TaxID=3127458 RepID=UPI00301DD9FC
MKRISTLLLFCLLLGVSTTFAQQQLGTLKGKVVTADGKAVAYAIVALENTSSGTTTRDDGTFALAAHTGSYTLTAHAIGATVEKRMVQLESQQTLELPPIRLKQKAVELQQVVVTGQYEPQSVRKSVYQMRTISSEQIKMRGATDVQGVLNNELGIRFDQDLALGSSNLSLQGISGQNVKVLLDGAPLVGRGGTSNEININQLDVNNIERIEIVEGPMSVVYGADALAGVINIISKKPQGEQLTLQARLHEETISKEYGAGRGIHNQSARVTWQRSGWQVAGGFSHNQFSGLKENQEGRGLEWAWHPKEQWLGDVAAGYRSAKVHAWYRLNLLDETINSLGTFVNGKATDKNFLSKRIMHQAQADWQISDKINMTSVASYTDFGRRTQGVEVEEETGRETLSLAAGAQDHTRFEGASFRGTVHYKLSPVVALQPGLDLNLEKGSGERLAGSAGINDYAVFFSAELKPKPRINIRPGLRLVHNSAYEAPPVIPSLHAKVSLTEKLDLRLAYGRGFRAPSLRELYFNFHDASHNIVGNTNLQAELSHSFNGSLAWQVWEAEQMQVLSTLGGFYNHLEHLITTGQDERNPTHYTYINIEKYKTTGVSLQNTLRLHDLEATVGASYIGRYNQLYEQQQGLELFTWYPEVNLNATYTFTKAGASLGFFYKYTGALPTYVLGSDAVYLAQINGYSWADITATKSLGKLLTLQTGVKNLLNVKQVSSSEIASGGAHSTGGNHPMGYGRSFFLGLSFRFAK